jgi:hypothetical protein
MIPLSISIAALKERKKRRKYEKHEVWRRKNREIINEKKRLKERARKGLS